MTAFWRKYFSIPSDGHISDRLLVTRLTLDVCLILLYLACMSYAAYALFCCDAATIAAQIPA